MLTGTTNKAYVQRRQRLLKAVWACNKISISATTSTTSSTYQWPRTEWMPPVSQRQIAASDVCMNAARSGIALVHRAHAEFCTAWADTSTGIWSNWQDCSVASNTSCRSYFTFTTFKCFYTKRYYTEARFKGDCGRKWKPNFALSVWLTVTRSLTGGVSESILRVQPTPKPLIYFLRGAAWPYVRHWC